MSHIVQAKTSIFHPNLELLEKALAVVAKAHEGGRVANHILNFSRKPEEVNTHLALFTNELIRGIGIKLDPDGAMKFTGDPWDAEEAFEAIQKEILQTYVSLATMIALEAMGYTSEADPVDNQVVIRGMVSNV